MAASRTPLAPTDESENPLLARQRSRFLEVLDEEEPLVREELEREGWPPFRVAVEAALARHRLAEGTPISFLPPISEDLLLDALPEVSAWPALAAADSIVEATSFITWLDSWAKKWNVNAPWVLDAAIRTLHARCLLPRLQDEHPNWLQPESEPIEWEDTWVGYNPVFDGAVPEDVAAFEFTGWWQPNIESEQKARARLKRQFDAELNTHISKARKAAADGGYSAGAEVRKFDDHVRMLVRYQVVGETFTAIARSLDIANPETNGRSTVSKSVKKVAELLVLPLRSE